MTKREFITLGIGIAPLVACGQIDKALDDPERRAFDAHEKLETGLDPYRKQWGSWFTEERWKNWRKSIPNLVKLSRVVSVSVGSTTDTQEMIITLIDVDGKRSTIWCSGTSPNNNPVRSISPY